MLALFALALLAGNDSLVVSPAWLAAHRNDPDLVIVDVGMMRETYERGHLPGARWLNPHEIIDDRRPGSELPPVTRIDSVLGHLGITSRSRIVYYGDTWMAPRFFLALEFVGLGDHAALLDGGLEAWRVAGQPVSTTAPEWTATKLSSTTHPEILADADWIRAKLGAGSLALVDGRSPGEYSAADLGERLPRPGHIPGAVNLPWERTFTDGAGALDGKPSPLQPAATLRRLFGEAGMRPGADLVTYCTVGLRAAHLYFVARYLGYHPRIYDGSMSEWSRKPDFPVVTGSAPR